VTDAGDELQALRAHPFAQRLTEPQLERLFPWGKAIDADAGAFIIREGEPADRLFLIRVGQVALEQHVGGPAATLMETLRDGDLLGFSWLFEGSRWTLDARAVEPTELFALDGARVRDEMQADPALGLAVYTQLTQQLYGRLQRARLQRLDVYRATP
jgi:CRP-like cAMP-binding protein